MLSKLLSILTSVMLTTSAFASTLTLNPERTVNVIDVVDVEIVEQANKLNRLSLQSTDPIYLVVNSPGGSVATGTTFLDTMAMAQARGVELRCISGVLAASMAFHIMAKCDERYALANTKLLFHPVRVFIMHTALTPSVAMELALDLQRIENHLKPEVMKALDMNEAEFDYHNERETLWFGTELEQLGFLKVVNEVIGTDNLLTISRADLTESSSQLKELLKDIMPNLFEGSSNE